MSYNDKNYAKIREEYREKPQRARAEAEAREAELWSKVPGVSEIDRILRATGPRILAASSLGRDGLDDRINAIKKEITELRTRRGELLIAAGYPADYSDIKYECPACRDTGYVGVNMCDCMKRALSGAGYVSAGIAALIARQSFDNFSLNYYVGADRQKMEFALSKVKNFADNFTAETAESFLFLGGTGLGKTHLSTAAAKTVIDRGYDVVYETAQNMFADFETERFHSDKESARETSRYFECDLLIIDDLGTEVSNNFTVSCLYNVINTRQNERKPMMISTNLDAAELRRRYSDRITSRLLGEFLLLMFSGEDVRLQKIRNDKA